MIIRNQTLNYKYSTFLNKSEYRYGFNGMEKDDEAKGKGNSYDFGARMYDSRLGRWLSLDPLANKYLSLSPYNFVGNMPITAIDPNGKEIIVVTQTDETTGKTKMTITLTGKVVFDYLTTTASDNRKASFVEGLNTQLKSTYSQAFEDIEVEFISKLEGATESEIEDSDHVIYVMNMSIGPEAQELKGERIGGFVTGIGSKKAFFPLTRNQMIPVHEIGHWLGLYHPKDLARFLSMGEMSIEGEDVYMTTYNYEDVYKLFSKDNFMHHPGDPGVPETGGMKFEQIQAEMIQAAYEGDALNKGSNKKTGNLKSELDGGISNSKAKKISKDVAVSKLTGTKQK